MSDGVFYKEPIPSLDTLSTEVIAQLKHRADIFSKKSTDEFTPEFIQQYLNGNNAWVRVVSGVKVIDDDKAHEQFILQGGTLSKDRKQHRQGFDFENSFIDSDKGFYTFEENEGMVPTPGILSFSVTNRGNSGFTREANIVVRCYSRAQLAKMEQLYMRPGFPILVEWGHSVYVDKGGSANYEPQKLSDETAITTSPQDPKVIEDAISKTIEDSGQNYDALLGFVKNYEWRYEPGFYELNIEVLGKGAASEFTKTMYGVQGQSTAGAQDEIEFDEAESLDSNFASIFNRIAKTTVRTKGDDVKDTINEVEQDRLDTALKKYEDDITGIIEEINSPEGDFELKAYYLPFKTTDIKWYWVYVPLRFVLGAINYYYMPKIGGQAADKGKFTTKSGRCLYLTYEDHFSGDIETCLLPQQTGTLGLDTKDLPGERDGTGEMTGDIMDIYVNAYKVYDLYTKIKNEATADKEFTIQYFLKSLMEQVETAIGGINDFELYNDFYLDSELGPSMVVDRNVLPNPSLADKEVLEIPVMGKKSYLRSLSVDSQLSNSMLNYIVSQAIIQGQSADKATNDGMSRFNAGIEKRFTVSGDTQQGGNTPKEAFEKKKATFQETFDKLTKSKSYQKDASEKISTTANEIMPYDLQTAMASSKNSDGKGPARGHVGANLNLEMLGIGGIKILQFFTLPEKLLPESYVEAGVGFQVNNVSHDINNGMWTTRLEARAVILKK